MKNLILALSLISPLLAQAAPPDERGETLWHCVPLDSADPSGLNFVTITGYLNNAGIDHEMSLAYTRAGDRSETEFGPAIELDDFDLSGYGSEELGADLLFYADNAEGGARDVLLRNGVETLLVCDYVPGQN